MLFIAKGHQVMPPGRQLALRIQAGLSGQPFPRPEGIVRDVIFARPQQLHRNVDLLRDPGGLHR